jgi:translation initiation factor IF-3
MLLIDQNGQSQGEVSRAQALELAESIGLDLVEVSPMAVPPVCKILDFGKMIYEETRAERKAKANQKTIDVKEIRLSLKISDHDLELKINQAKKFLTQGNKVRVVIKMKGREQIFAERAFATINEIGQKIGGKIEQSPSKLGNQISITIA